MPFYHAVLKQGPHLPPQVLHFHTTLSNAFSLLASTAHAVASPWCIYMLISGVRSYVRTGDFPSCMKRTEFEFGGSLF